MAERVQLRRSSTPGEVPTSLLPGELAINEADVKLYAGTADGNVIEVTSTLETDLATLLQTVTTQGQTIAAQAQTLTTQGQSINGLNTAVATALHNPALASQNMGGFALTNVAQGTANSDAARLDQVGWQQIRAVTNITGTNAAAFTFPVGYTKVRVEWVLACGADGGALCATIATGLNWDWALHYGYALTDTTGGGSTTTVGGATTYLPLGNNRTGARSDVGSLELSLGAPSGEIQNTFSGTILAHTRGGFNYTGGTPTALYVALNAGAFTGGAARLLGWKT